MTMLQRVVLGNALVVLVGALILAASPATISARITAGEAGVLAVGTALALAVNVVAMRRTLRPLRALAGEMAAVDPLAPAPPHGPRTGAGEVAALARAFDAMVGRLLHERRASARAAIAAQERERERLGRELHDEVGQALTGVALELQGIEDLEPGARDERIAAAREAVRAASDGVREIARGLRPEALEDFGLRGALVALASTLADRAQVRVRRVLDAGLPALAPEVELVVYRVAQEALTNVARHAGAREVLLVARAPAGRLELVVCDDGRGIPPGASGTGLQGMRERAMLAGGALVVGPGPQGGTEVRLTVPVAVAGARS
ncbi:HAMP domain-containing protein [Baekduia soli]|uniref:histidine kinase n=1 Tax=Baekduia soli TaxID=496014 RepID=A0A5B8U438_9ACTN|nr:histidine kinase [Baekduia soli]QEC47701.1 HAMP domain-containing protein [Baekduia soli]